MKVTGVPVAVTNLSLSKSNIEIPISSSPVAINRAQLCRFLVNSLGLADESTSISFSDVAVDYEYYHDIKKACNAGVICGYPDGRFCPEGGVSRAEYAVIVIKALKYPVSNQVTTISDIQNHWAKGYIITALNAGLMKLNNDGTFKPADGTSINMDGQLVPIITPVDATDKKIIWSSDDETVAIVDQIGCVVGLKEGTTIINARTEDGNIIRSCFVKVTDTIQNVDECFIATAAYGSKFQPAVVLLRQFRDQYLLTNALGTAFVKLYYKHSPPMAFVIANSQPLKVLVRVLLTPVVAIVYLMYHPPLLATILVLVCSSLRSHSEDTCRLNFKTVLGKISK